MHTVTLKQILDKQPCERGMAKLLKGLNIEIPFNIEGHCLLFKCLTEEELNKPIALKFILDNNGLEDALWCLKIFNESKDWKNLEASMFDIIKPQFLKKNLKRDFFRSSVLSIRCLYAICSERYFTEDSENKTFKTQVTELFIKHFCQEEK
jgi:hypothetical protein